MFPMQAGGVSEFIKCLYGGLYIVHIFHRKWIHFLTSRKYLSSPLATIQRFFVLGEVFEFSWKEAIELFVRTAIKIVGCWTKAIEVEG